MKLMAKERFYEEFSAIGRGFKHRQNQLLKQAVIQDFQRVPEAGRAYYLKIVSQYISAQIALPMIGGPAFLLQQIATFNYQGQDAMRPPKFTSELPADVEDQELPIRIKALVYEPGIQYPSTCSCPQMTANKLHPCTESRTICASPIEEYSKADSIWFDRHLAQSNGIAKEPFLLTSNNHTNTLYPLLAFDWSTPYSLCIVCSFLKEFCGQRCRHPLLCRLVFARGHLVHPFERSPIGPLQPVPFTTEVGALDRDSCGGSSPDCHLATTKWPQNCHNIYHPK